MVMKNFKLFLKEEINKEKIEKTIERFYEISGLDATGYYLKSGSPVFAMGFYEFINKKGSFISLSDDETEDLHIVVNFDNYYWDINGKGNLKEKEEFISTIGEKKWKSVSEDDVLSLVDSSSEIMEVYTKLKNIYSEKHFEE